jgi:predicted nucleic acid-binding protein
MKVRVALDTNVLIDLLLEGRPGKEAAQQIVSAAQSGAIEAQVSTQSIIDAAYTCRKQGANIEAFREAIRKMRTIVKISAIDWIDLAWALAHDSGDFEDDMQYASAYNSVCDYFITRDKALQQLNDPYIPMTVITPKEFVKKMLAD